MKGCVYFFMSSAHSDWALITPALFPQGLPSANAYTARREQSSGLPRVRDSTRTGQDPLKTLSGSVWKSAMPVSVQMIMLAGEGEWRAGKVCQTQDATFLNDTLCHLRTLVFGKQNDQNCGCWLLIRISTHSVSLMLF